MTQRTAWLGALAVAGTVVCVDQVTKVAVEANIEIGERIAVVGPLELTNVGNTGIAFGLAGGGGLAIIALAVAALGLILGIFAREPTRTGAWLAVGLLVGGAVGNLIDRIAKDAVTDFVSLPMWPAFNVADIAITVGVILLAWFYLRTPTGAAEDGVEA